MDFSHSDNFNLIPSGTEKMMKIIMRQTDRKSTRNYGCDESNEAKYTKCIESFIVGELQCKPTWYQMLDNNMMLPFCKGSEKYQKFLGLIHDLSKANCIVPNCKKKIWDSQEIWTTQNPILENTTTIQYVIFSKTVKVSEEVFTYEVFDIFNDFAGVLSLFLGVSIISFYDYLVETSKTIYNKFNQ